MIDREKVAKMVMEEYSVRDIMRECNVSHGTVSYYRKKLGFFYDTQKYLDWESVQKFHDSNGASVPKIAKEFGVCVSTIIKGIKKGNLLYTRYSQKGNHVYIRKNTGQKQRYVLGGVEEYKCLNCGKKIASRKFCSSKCQFDFANKNKINNWKNGLIQGHSGKSLSIKQFVRRYILEKYNYKCSECGFSGVNKKTGNTIIQVDHIDGNPANTIEENLRTLCPNCHAMTTTYMALNVSNPNRTRRKRSGKQILY